MFPSASVYVQPSTILYTTVRQSDKVLSLPAILASLSEVSLSNHLTTLRRDLTNHYIDRILIQPSSVTTSSDASEHKLSYFPSPPNTENRIARLENLSQTLTFLSTEFFPVLPPSQSANFRRSLCKPTVTSILNNLLIPSLPSSFSHLPAFLELARQAVVFEDKYVVEMLGNDESDRTIKPWTDGIGGHYERRRRLEILERSRLLIIAPERVDDRFHAQVSKAETQLHEIIPAQMNEVADDSWGLSEAEDQSNDDGLAEVEGNGWSFDDDELELESMPASTPDPAPSDSMAGNDRDERDPTDAWGWNDEEEDALPDENQEETAWDDPWSEAPSTTNSSAEPPSSSPAPSIPSPRVATRLEKLANKGKRSVNGGSPMSPPIIPVAVGSPQKSVPGSGSSTSNAIGKPPLHLASPIISKESYLVSGRMKQIIAIVEEVLAEGEEFCSSKLIPHSESTLPPGSLLLQSAASILDLFRALYPIKFGSTMSSTLEGPMQFSNDCLYLADEVDRLEHNVLNAGLGEPVNVRLLECKQRLKILGDSWFYDSVVRVTCTCTAFFLMKLSQEKQKRLMDDILIQGAEGFTFTGDQDRYDECETAVNQVLQEIRRLAQRWKVRTSRFSEVFVVYMSCREYCSEASTTPLSDQ